MNKVYAVCFGQYGPYHHARVSALQDAVETVNTLGAADEQAKITIIPVQISKTTRCGSWTDVGTEIGIKCEGLQTLCDELEDQVNPLDVYLKALNLFRTMGVELVFLPSYSPARLLALFAAAKTLGIRTVMMNESHAGTDRAKGWKKRLKREIVKRFDAALVGGEPHKRHFANLGIAAAKIQTGYDAVANTYFSERSGEIRSAQSHYRNLYGLPSRYFLSMGRMVSKKNLSTLIDAYSRYVATLNGNHREYLRKEPVALVLVGSGDEEGALESQAQSLGLHTIDRRGAGSKTQALVASESADSQLSGLEGGAVYFYGYRQIDENPIFYALADAFILPSLHEEWGLVVNEAMASSIPVIVSRAAGCAEDLLPSPSKTPSDLLERCSNGFVFDPTSADALAQALSQIANSEASELTQMGQRSLEIVSLYSCEEFARKALLAADAALA